MTIHKPDIIKHIASLWGAMMRLSKIMEKSRGGGVLGGTSLFHNEGEGSKPISPHQLRLVRIPKYLAALAYKEWHYYGAKGFLASVNYGVYFEGRLFGAISYGIPNARNINGLYTSETQGQWFELTRLALSDDCPKNSESRVIAVSLRLLRKEHPEKVGVITYADTAQQHTGTIYKASGFDYLGLTAQKTDLFLNGKPVGKLKGVKYSELGGTWIKRSRKHLFRKSLQ